MSVSIAMATELLSRNACSFLKPDRKGFQTRGGIGYSLDRAVVVEGATLATFVTGPITLIIIRVLLDVIGLGVFCWALFALAIHALRFFVGMTVGIYTFQTEASPFGAIVVGFVMAGFTLVVGQYAFSVARFGSSALSLGYWSRFRQRTPAMM
jgi:hypothetical protein